MQEGDVGMTDMYGHVIVPLDETGFGISTTWHRRMDEDFLRPQFTFFHFSDGFRQSLFSIDLTDNRFGHPGPMDCNIFEDRCYEVLNWLRANAPPLH